jgi:aminoglycoside phosphotransferase (APT) family kinase protein
VKSALLSREQIEAICRRAFGPEAGLLGLEPFRGGTHNQVYRLSLAGRLPVILRVAPPDTADLAWDERNLMRREHAIRPAFAPLAHLMPTPLFVDFTHAVIDRDYMLQTFIEGHRWEDVAEQLEPAEALPLWRAFGALLRQIHAITGERFGDPPPGESFQRWSEALAYRLARVRERLLETGLAAEAGLVSAVQARAAAERALVDEVNTPRLLHGDLWLFNLLLRETPDGPRLVGVLDADRAWWGDPPADWTMFVLAKLQDPGMAPAVAGFWEGYGEVEPAMGTAFRQALYEALHIGTALAYAARAGDQATVARGRAELPPVVARLTARLTE